jgi:hypothetical protein
VTDGDQSQGFDEEQGNQAGRAPLFESELFESNEGREKAGRAENLASQECRPKQAGAT